MTQSLLVNSLDYDDIRTNLVSFLQSQVDSNGNEIYRDYDFQGSGISTIINLLSYHTHYLRLLRKNASL